MQPQSNKEKHSSAGTYSLQREGGRVCPAGVGFRRKRLVQSGSSSAL